MSEGVHCSESNGVPADTPFAKFSRFYKSGFTKGTRLLHGQKGPARRGVSGGVQATAKPARPSTRSAARSKASRTARSPVYAATEIPSPEPRYIPLQDHGTLGRRGIKACPVRVFGAGEARLLYDQGGSLVGKAGLGIKGFLKIGCY